MQLLGEIRAARNTFDNADTSRSFGSAVVNYAQVQAKVNAKYDSWQKEILSRFGQRLGGAMAEFFGVISKGRNELEAHSLDGEKTTDAVVFITFVGVPFRFVLFHSKKVLIKKNAFTGTQAQVASVDPGPRNLPRGPKAAGAPAFPLPCGLAPL